MTKFASVGTSAARFQDLSMNPQKLAGQCAKLKCCLNFEVDTYMEAQRKLPHKDINLETKDETLYYFKADILKREVTYTTAKGQAVNCVTIPASRAFEIIALNKRGIKVDSVVKEAGERDAADKDYFDLAGQESLTRFDKSKRKKKKSNKAGGTAKGQEAKQPQPKGNKQQPQGAKQPQPQAKPKSQPQGGNKPPKQQGPKPQAKQPGNPNVNKKRKKPEQQ
jgi:hypothetical protein